MNAVMSGSETFSNGLRVFRAGLPHGSDSDAA